MSSNSTGRLEPKMLCDKCWGMLRGHEGKVWKGTYILHFDHHQDLEMLRKSAELHCSICRKLFGEWTKQDFAAFDAQPLDQPQEPRKEANTKAFSSTASLSVVRGVDKYDLFRLDFRLECETKVRRRTFVLKQTGQSRYIRVSQGNWTHLLRRGKQMWRPPPSERLS